MSQQIKYARIVVWTNSQWKWIENNKMSNLMNTNTTYSKDMPALHFTDEVRKRSITERGNKVSTVLRKEAKSMLIVQRKKRTSLLFHERRRKRPRLIMELTWNRQRIRLYTRETIIHCKYFWKIPSWSYDKNDSFQSRYTYSFMCAICPS